MEKKFTPGPWEHRTGMNQMISDKTTVASLGIRTKEEGAMQDFIFSDAEEHGDQEADAKLIAAAPEMLDALLAEEAWREEGNPEKSEDLRIKAARLREAAIKKATS
jgi:hypothetical protein